MERRESESAHQEALERLSREIRLLLERANEQLGEPGSPKEATSRAHEVLLELQVDDSVYVLSRHHQTCTKGLSGRQRQVMRLVCDGCTNQKIAERLEISHATVAAHMRRLFDRFGVQNRTQLARAGMTILGVHS